MNWWVDDYWNEHERKQKAERRTKVVRQKLFRQAGRGELEIILELSAKGERVIPQYPVLQFFCDMYLPDRNLILEISSVGPGSKKWRRLMERKAQIEAQGLKVVYVPSRTTPEAIWRYLK